MRMKLGWLANTRPDVLFEIVTLAQVTEEYFNNNKRECLRRLNGAIRYAIQQRIPLVIQKLDASSVLVVGYADASFANNPDLSAQIGYIILLPDQHVNSEPITFK